MASPLESDGDEPSSGLPQRGAVIGRVVPRTTLRPAGEAGAARDDGATDEELAALLRRTDPRTEGDAPSVERVRTSLVDAVSSSESSDGAPDAAPPAQRARAIADELDKCGPGDELAHLEPMRALGSAGLAVLAERFPGLLWFDRRLPHRKRPRGRDASPVCSLLVRLGDAAAPVVRALLESPDASKRFYAALVAGELGAGAVVIPLAALAFDEDEEVREVALVGLADLARRREERALCDAAARSLEEAAARIRVRLGSPECTPVERVHALAAVHALRDPRALDRLVPFVAWIERDVAATAREALTRITAEDFGADASAWAKWVRKHGAKPRVEWLVAALSGSRSELRAYANEELVRLLGDFGYTPDLGPIDRMLAQRRALTKARARGLLA